MIQSVNYLSQCPVCAGCTESSVQPGIEAATCLQCGTDFLLPMFPAVPDYTGGMCAGTDLIVTSEAPADAAAWLHKCKTTGLATTISVLFNSAILLVLGFCVFADGVSEPTVKLTGRLAAAEEVESFDLMPVLDTGGINDRPDANPDPIVLSQVTTQVVTPSDSGQFALPAGVSGLAGGGAGGGSGRGHGLFTGAEAAGSFAYVVDASGSMDGGRMRLVLHELARSIGALSETQDFFVVFFSDRTFPMMWPKTERRLIAASRENQNRILDWAFTVRPDGGTNPQLALRQALDLRPDVVYFLTDGQIPPMTIDVVRKHRKEPTVVHTISVGSRAAQDMMQQIAQTGGGVFTDVR